MRFPDALRLYTAPSDIRTKWPSARRVQLYYTHIKYFMYSIWQLYTLIENKIWWNLHKVCKRFHYAYLDCKTCFYKHLKSYVSHYMISWNSCHKCLVGLIFFAKIFFFKIIFLDTFKIPINSHGTSWQLTADIVLNAAIQFFQNFFSVEISPEMNRKLTGNDIL